MLEDMKEIIEEGSEEHSLVSQLDPKRLPAHVAVIMDGNGRWAKQRGLKRNQGHKEGAVSAKKIIENARRTGIKCITLYAFSSENWKRPITEINALMNMLYESLVNETEQLMENDIRLGVVGDIGKLPGKLKKKLLETMELSANNKTLQVNLALNYGARMEMVTAVKRIIKDGLSPSKINEKLISDYLYTAGNPELDLMIRTSGELRLSNFLLYQAAYAELYFTPVPWPDFRLKELLEALVEYQKRQRRFGSV